MSELQDGVAPEERFALGGALRRDRPTILLARDRATGRPAIVKLADGPAGALLLDRERRALALLGAARSYAVLASGRAGGRSWLAIERIEGPTLAEVLSARGRLPPAEALALALALARALERIHGRGIVHRDVKPENVIVRARAAGDAAGDAAWAAAPLGVVLVDFGYALLGDDRDEPAAAAQGALVGTPAYAAPEQIAGKAVDARADLYALGVILYEMLAGKLPFPPRDAASLLAAKLADRAPELDAAAGPLPRRLPPLIERLLRSDPAERPGSAAAVAAALEDCRAELRADAVAGALEAPRHGSGRFFGRDREMAALASLLEQCASGAVGLAALSGDGGSGKSRLLSELADRARRQGVLVLAARCEPAHARTPLDPIAAAVHEARGALGDLPDLLTPQTAEDAAVSRRARALAAALAGLDRPVLIAIDDLQWADSETEALLPALLRAARGRLLLALASREPRRLEAATAAAREIGAALEGVAVGPLARPDALDLLADLLALDERGRAEADRAIGTALPSNPFLILDLAAAILEEGGLTRIGAARARTLGSASLARRFGELSPTARAAVVFAAALGESIETALVGRALDRLGLGHGDGPAAARAALAESARARLVAADGPERFRFPHDRVREATELLATPAERERAHGLAADLLAEDGPGALFRVAHHRVRAGDPQAAFSALVSAGREARRLFANRQAATFLEEAESVGATFPDDEARRLRADLALERAAVYEMLGDFAAAGRAAALALELAASLGDERRRGSALYWQGVAAVDAGDYGVAIGRFRTALALAEATGDRALAARSSNYVGQVLVVRGDLDEAARHLARDIAIREEDREPWAAALSLAWLGAVHAFRGERAAGRRTLGRARALAERAQDRRTLVVVFALEGFAALAEGDARAAEAAGRAALDLGLELGESIQELNGNLILGGARTLAGEPHAAIEHLERAIAVEARIRFPFGGTAARIELARALVAVGRPEAALAAAEEALALASGALGSPRYEALACWAAADALLAGRPPDLGAAGLRLDRAIELLTRCGAAPERGRALLARSSLRARSGEAALARADAAAAEAALAAIGLDPTSEREALLRRGRRSGEAALGAVFAVARDLSAIDDVEELLARLVDQAIALFGAERGFVIVRGLGQGAGLFEIRAARAADGRPLDRGELALSMTAVSEAERTGEPVLVADAGEDQRFGTRESVVRIGLRSILCAPLVLRGRAIGAIYLDSRLVARCFDRRDAELLGTLASQAAVSIDRARAHDEVRRLTERLRAEKSDLLAELGRGPEPRAIAGRSPALARALAACDAVAPTGATVLIRGETGTGKELVAERIHAGSGRRGPLVRVNCGALPTELAASELFGHERGAFTGAHARKAGRFELARDGTIFLDEVGELPPEAQAVLLRVLEAGEFERLGGTTTLRTNARVLAATNRDLARAADDGSFRRDLYYRLAVFEIELPPLRERLDDLPELAAALLARHARRLGRPVPALGERFLAALARHAWPGNVRELENALERALILGRGQRVLDEPEALGLALAARPLGPTTAMSPPAAPPLAPPVLSAEPGRPTLAELERRAIVAALERTRWRVSGPQGAARILGINASTLRSRMKKLGLDERATGG
jgi:transcriptional regulator with GAF, ATPase, and Fis domain